MLHCEAAMVTSGAVHALLLGTKRPLLATGNRPGKIKPHPTRRESPTRSDYYAKAHRHL